MAIDWSQEQLIQTPTSFTSYFPDQSGSIIAYVVGQGVASTSELGWAYVGDYVVGMWVTGGNFIYDTDGITNSYANMSGSATLPVAGGSAFSLNISVYTTTPPYIYFWWVPGAGDGGVAGDQDRAALHDKMLAVAERTRPSAGKRS